MSAQMFTKGPWWMRIEYSTIYVEGNARDPRVYQDVAAVGPKEGGPDQQIADARLITAAPALLEALQGVVRVADRATAEFDAARAAIALATGETP